MKSETLIQINERMDMSLVEVGDTVDVSWTDSTGENRKATFEIKEIDTRPPFGGPAIIFGDVEGRDFCIDIGHIDKIFGPAELHADACPGCGNRPGDGITEDCYDEDGCNYHRKTLTLEGTY